MNKKQYLVFVQERYTNKVFAYIDVVSTDSYYAKGTALKQIEHEQQYTKKWDMLKNVDWCLDAVEI
jgi:hypothetical protein